ncbi:MAG: murein hydrolase activator EnvC [Xanthobacteraceae bacterium]|nr:murein hydrolase activator EnvC [Xanthobacteraceae bacterium]
MILALDRPPGQAVVAAGLLAVNAGLPALAQTAVPDPLKQRTQELEALRNEQKKAAETTERLQREVEAIGEDRRKLSASLIETAGRVRMVEDRIAGSEARLQPLGDKERALRASLDKRRTAIAEVLAALQRMGRRPPPAIVVRPEDALEAVRSAILLGAVLPDMRNEAASLANDLSDLVHLRADITAEREKLAGDLAALSQERLRMAALISERQKRQAEVGTALDAERQRAAQLGRQIDNLKDLINKLDQGPEVRPVRPVARPSDTGANPAGTSGLGPTIAFASAKGLLPLPVNGVKIKGFGVPDGLGGSEKGITIATRPGAQVTAPCDGWVVYAAPYRSYGQLLILNAGGGYHVLVAGMDRISVDVGQFVLTGEPVAVMGNGAPVASVAAVGAGPPGLYVEFRKDGVPIDPTPWWAINDNEKVRG